jgi:hypothetical protein
MRHFYTSDKDDGPGDTTVAAAELGDDFTSQTSFCIHGRWCC